MNGILLIAVIACLLFTIGMGFGLITIHQENEWLKNDIKQLKAAQNNQDRQNLIQLDTIEDHYKSLERYIDRVRRQCADNTQSLALDIKALKMLTCGTDDISEFMRLKTQVWSSLTPRMKALEEIIGIRPVETMTVHEGLLTKEVPMPEQEEKENG